MIRDFLVAITFFFGPMLLMFVLRSLGPLIVAWFESRRQRASKNNIINITPKPEKTPSLAFVMAAVIVGALSAYWAWHYTQQGGNHLRKMQYVPAHLDQNGHIIPGKFVKNGRDTQKLDAPRSPNG